ncbi:DUF2993 domain-containing protein [Streptomyces sp. NPDC002187]|uniref:LmeA family phospholipid-binding protein n=1 Tax=Streptomyces sp. NPDC002187 TaxID=3364637 RepID=UPI00369EBEC6
MNGTTLAMKRTLARLRGRRLWTVLGLSTVLAALPVADRVAAARAEARLADRIAHRQSAVVGTPQVRIDAFPFLLSAAEGTFSRVEVRADAVTGEGRPVQAAVELRDVREEAGGYTAARADARFTAPFGSLVTGLGPDASLSAAGSRQVRMDRVVLGLPLSVTAELRLSGRTVTMVPVAASFAGRQIDPADPRIAQVFAGRERAVPELPAGLGPTDVSVTGAGVTLHARGDDVRLDRDPSGTV